MNFRMKIRIAKALAILLGTALAPMAQAQDLSLPKASSDPVILRVAEGLPDPEMLKVTLPRTETPIAGHYAVDGNTIRFTPVFGFDAGRDYVVRLPNDGKAVPFRDLD